MLKVTEQLKAEWVELSRSLCTFGKWELEAGGGGVSVVCIVSQGPRSSTRKKLQGKEV